ncbi:cation:proton antiporter [Frateuria aurantia]|uniref:Kef-type K+ transport system, membrane component n=1 Tax=Frateuria aurantia (strain ATCC 33424 / DSM 6220 / KCTC 2777 / LMG 1558 / NBRC 3245 / NCIMB 13370) TaxID=767434 RepID=H8L6X5_FRAAD|nr:cation:proton antiporter [Frateuria aurantia]AFC86885.1 Kef-type K+ transport system, membrane component [Frateuria aurantia DSM 6220]
MHEMHFLQDLATVMLVAGVTSVLFQRLGQPVVLGYIIAGVLVGPHALPALLIHDESTIKTLSTLGMILLLFALGLEFSLRKLRKVGMVALVVASCEIILMLWIGYEVGRRFQWTTMDSLFLGAMMSISSTAIITSALDELGLKRERFAQLVFGVLIVEDILAVVLLALLTGIAKTGGLQPLPALAVLGKLGLFIAGSLIGGLLLVPKVVDYVAQGGRDEVLLVAVLGLLFGFCLLVSRMGYSVALGAFMMGALVAEARSLPRVERVIMPLRDMFSAMFFVAIGMLINPRQLWHYAVPVLVITLAVVVGKVVTCALGSYLAGTDGRTSVRIGAGLAQIGEFSFIIASLGLSLHVTSDFLYPVAVAVSALTTLLTPYLIRASDPVATAMTRCLPDWLRGVLVAYTRWIGNLSLRGQSALVMAMIRRLVWHIVINTALVAALFLVTAFAYRHGFFHVAMLSQHPGARRSVAWSVAAVLSLPMLVAVYRKAMALGMLLAELAVPVAVGGEYNLHIRNALARLIPLGVMCVLALLVTALASTILPPRQVVWVLLLAGGVLTWLLWHVLVKVHARFQAALLDVLSRGDS